MGDHNNMGDHNSMGSHSSDSTMGDHNSMGDHSSMGDHNSMGCCETKRVPGTKPKSGTYYLDTEYSDAFPDFCKDSCAYIAESGPGRFCFKPSSMYTAECQDTGASAGVDTSDHHESGHHGDTTTTTTESM